MKRLAKTGSPHSPAASCGTIACNLEAWQYLNFSSLADSVFRPTSESITETRSPEPVESSVTRDFVERIHRGLLGPDGPAKPTGRPSGEWLDLHAGLYMIASSTPARSMVHTRLRLLCRMGH